MYTLLTVGKDIEITIAQSVMEQHAVLLRKSRWSADYVDNRHIFSIRASNTIERRQFTNAKRGAHGRDTFDASISICGIRSSKLVSIPYPLQAAWLYVVK